jgi:deoxyribonuclease V
MHPWNLTVDEAKILQQSLAEDCVLEGDPDVETVAGVDISMRPDGEHGFASVVLYSLPRETILREVVLIGDLTFPYMPGLLAFREAPLMMQALMKLDREPDCLIVDGHGYAHPRRFGLASHLGLVMECPSIGCAKSNLVGDYEEPGLKLGSFTDIWDGEPIGYTFRSRRDANPIFLSPGHRISRENVLPIVRELLSGRTKLPVPVHRADKIAGRQRKHIEDLTEPFVERDIGVFLVGGALRDLLAGRPPSDYDLLVTEFPDDVREKLTVRYDSHFFDIDEENRIHRLVSDSLQLDVTVVDEDEVVENLEDRDFTINSIALDMNRKNWVDPTDGREDIRQERLEPTCPASLREDPLRVLRAYRFVTDLEFDLSDAVRGEIEEAGSALAEVARERIVEEWFKVLELSDPLKCLSSMRDDGVFRHVPFLREEGIDEIETLVRWVPLLEGYELFSEEFHGGYSLLKGLQVGRLMTPKDLRQWPLHRRIKTITVASHDDLEGVPDRDVLLQSRWKLLGQLLGQAFGSDWDADQFTEALSRLQRFLHDRDLIEKDIVEDLRENGEDEESIGPRKEEQLREELPGLWENRMTPILEY